MRRAPSASRGSPRRRAPPRAAPCARRARSRPLVTMARLARVTVSSSRTTNVAGLDPVAVAHPQLADHAAGRVLHLLDVRIDDDRARARSARRKSPSSPPSRRLRRRGTPTITTPAKMWRRIEACELGHGLRFMPAPPLIRHHLQRPAAAAPAGSRGFAGLPPSARMLLAALGHDQNAGRRRRSRSGDGRPRRRCRRAARTPRMALGQRLVAFGVEVGIGLVEHDQERIAVERARQRDALAPGRPTAPRRDRRHSVS